MKKRNKKGIVLISLGVLLILISLFWCFYNLAEDFNAGEKANEILEKLDEQKINNDSPLITVEGETYCGKISIEKLGVTLPVYAEWSYAKLKTAPCRYIGGTETRDMIIAAHNYKSHFGNLKKLKYGDKILFIDSKGIEHKYSVKEIITLDGTSVSHMKSGEWDFTLFTCTKGGKQRVTVRCDYVEK